jgi:hypothetical protein
MGHAASIREARNGLRFSSQSLKTRNNLEDTSTGWRIILKSSSLNWV